jgi:hypothetical protein
MSAGTQHAASPPAFFRAEIVARRQSTIIEEEVEKQACTHKTEWQAYRKWRQACELQSAARINMI